LEREAEIELARRLIAGDTAAFDRFVAHFRAKIFHYTWLMCGHREDAEEVAQDVFESLDQLREPERVRAWVFRIAKNECLMKRRKSVFAPACELSLDGFPPAAAGNYGERQWEIADWSSLPDAHVLEAEIKQEIERAINELPESYRSVILLRDMEELSTEETAQILDLHEDTVKTRLHRGRLALRQKLVARFRTAVRGSN
jgi:RNA polymerase sigma-70 factor, ECF subfamily